jgi:hypothetical protein
VQKRGNEQFGISVIDLWNVPNRELASLMVDCGLGVSEERVYRTYRIDSDFFEEGE